MTRSLRIAVVLLTITLLASLQLPIGLAQQVEHIPYDLKNVRITAGGFMPGLVYNTDHKDVLYTRADIGGAYRWDASQKQWLPLTDWVSQKDWTLLGIESLATDPTDPDRVYLAAGTYTNDWSGPGAMLASVDRGQTWHRFDLPFKLGGNEPGRSIGERVAVDPNHPSHVYFGARHGELWRTTDFGQTWHKLDTLPDLGDTRSSDFGAGVGVGIVLFDRGSGQPGEPTPVIIIGTGSAVAPLWMTRDAGKSWSPIEGQPINLVPHHAELDGRGNLYVTYGNGPGPNGMTDGAVAKLNLDTGEWADITPVKPGGENGVTFGYAGLTIDRQNPDTVMASTMDRWSVGDDIFRSTDGGGTWVSLREKAVMDASGSPFLKWGREEAGFGHWIGDVEIDPFNPNRALYVTGATIWGTDDLTNADKGEPTHWTVYAHGVEETAILGLISPPVGPHLISAIGDIGGFRHDDLAVTPDGMWTNPTMHSVHSIDFAEHEPAVIVRAGHGPRGQTAAISFDSAKTWRPLASLPAEDAQGGVIGISADAGAVVWSPERMPAYVTHDEGKTWRRAAGLPDAHVSLTADRENAEVFYAFHSERGEFYVSADGGRSFKRTASDLPRSGGAMRAVFGREGHVYLCTDDGGLHLTTDGGRAFTQLPAVRNAGVVGFGKAAEDSGYPVVFLAGAVGDTAGVFRSDDRGQTWVRINDDQHQYGWTNRAITGDPRIHGRVYFGTNGRGIIYGDPQ